MSSIYFRPIQNGRIQNFEERAELPRMVIEELAVAKRQARSLSPFLSDAALHEWFEPQARRNPALLCGFLGLSEEKENRFPAVWKEDLQTLASHLHMVEGVTTWDRRGSFEMIQRAISELCFEQGSVEVEICRAFLDILERSSPLAQLNSSNDSEFKDIMARWTMVHLQDLQVSERLMIPLAYSDHCVGLLVERPCPDQMSFLAIDPARTFYEMPYVPVFMRDDIKLFDRDLWYELLFEMKNESAYSTKSHTLYRELERIGRVDLTEKEDHAPESPKDACTIYVYLMLLYRLCCEMDVPEVYDSIEASLREWVAQQLEKEGL